jgi:hypothetical protein
MTEEHADTGVQIDGEPIEPDDVTDDTGELDADAEVSKSDPLEVQDDDEPTGADYEAAAAELAAEAEAAQSDDDGQDELRLKLTEVNADAEKPTPDLGGFSPHDRESTPLDGLDPKLATHIQKLRREAAEKRIALAATEERLQSAANVIGELQNWQSDRLRRDAEVVALEHGMIAPAEMWFVADLHEVLTDDDDIDRAKVAELIKTRVPEHWMAPRRQMFNHNPRSGASGIGGGRLPSWSDVLKPSQG